MDSEAHLHIEKQLEAARQRLLDLTMRNRLLNFRPSKSSTLRIVDEIPGEVFDLLVLNERVMEFLPKRQSADVTENLEAEGLNEDDEGLTEAEEQTLWSVTDAPEEMAGRYSDKYLQTTLDRAALQKRLFFIQKKAQSALEEQGYSILYLALGFLEWRESVASTQFRKAPVILIPVDLYRPSVGSSFRLRWTGEDLETNISLQAKLKEQGVVLPDFEIPESREGINSYFQKVEEAVRKEENWKVNGEIFLGFFSFTKFLMYKDLDPRSWPEGQSPSLHPLIQSILNPQGNGSFGEGFPEDEIDRRLNAHSVFHVMDADPSQIAVIEDAKAGHNLAVEGPPGTGKSQTITNMIAELLGAGKSVLFVSEKMAALEVVKNRLDQVGLGDFCLELHSRKSKKKEVIDELKRCTQREYAGPEYSEGMAAELDATKTQLNDYAEALRAPLGAMDRSPYNLLCTVEGVRRHFADTGKDVPVSSAFSNTLEWTNRQYTEAREAARDLSDVLALVQPLAEHPWHGCSPGLVLPADETEIGQKISKLREHLDSLEEALKQLSAYSGAQLARTTQEIPSVLEAARTIARFPYDRIDRSVLFHEDWVSGSGRHSQELIADLQTLQATWKRIVKLFKSRALEENIDSLLGEFKPRAAKLFRIFDGHYRMLKQQIWQLYREKPPWGNARVISQLEELAYAQRLRKKLAGADEQGKAIFGNLWQGEGGNTEDLRQLAEWMLRFHAAHQSGLLTEQAVEVLHQSDGRSKKIEQSTEAVLKATDLLQKARDACFERIQVDLAPVFRTEDPETIPLVDLRAKADKWSESLGSLQAWSRFLDQRKRFLDTVARELIETIDEDRLAPEDVLPAFELGTAESLLREAFRQRPALASFIGDLHEKKIGRFVDLDRRLIELNRTRVAKKLESQRPRLNLGAPAGSQLGILLAEFNRQRSHMPIRKLMKLTGPIIQKLKPCFMMSPMSIAQFLEPTTARFDVIIFDEASQVKPEDALGTLFRGKQAIVAGDTKQLPPTTFFDLLVQEDDRSEEEWEEAYVTDTESILHQCRRCFPTKLLKWHYRSRHESLIAVSNQEFYDNGLLFYPSPRESSQDLGVHFKELPDAVYDRGRSSVNRVEARAVSEACIEHYRQYPGKSLGIGTFNIKQQQAIWEEIELQLRRHPEMEDYFSSQRDDHFFVKNLETIQGDERDVIFLSIGFGPDARGQMTLNFGPLNHEGGWRRLNVLITRAREKVVVFSSFRASHLNLQPDTPWGVRALKVYLEFAETRNLMDISGPGPDTDSPFEEAVREFLHSHGYEVKRQVGCAGFRVDLGVVNPELPGCYLVGIECDGAKYHSSAVARDRDRLRQQILENLGWRILRLWSTDWYRNRAQTQDRLLREIEKIRRLPPNSQPRPGARVEVKPESAVVFREKENQDELSKLEDSIPPYKTCTSLPFIPSCDIHECPASRLAEAVRAVVFVEAPVHEDEVIRRIRTLWGLKRSGQRIQSAVSKAIRHALSLKKITRKNGFLWPPDNLEVTVRRRTDDPPPRIELISEEEIAEAIKLVLKNHYATLREDLVRESAKLFGIQAVYEATCTRINLVVDRLIGEGLVIQTDAGMLDLKSRSN